MCIHKSLSLSVSILQLPVPCCDMSCVPDGTRSVDRQLGTAGRASTCWVHRRWIFFADMIADPSPCKCYRFHGLARPPSGTCSGTERVWSNWDPFHPIESHYGVECNSRMRLV